jgi:hypothetical protein
MLSKNKPLVGKPVKRQQPLGLLPLKDFPPEVVGRAIVVRDPADSAK